jgi:hypothetical protein
MRSIWIAIGRSDDPEDRSVQHLYVFESSFDAHGFVNRIPRYDHLPEEARNIMWSVTEHAINESKVRALTDYCSVYEEQCDE